MTGPAINIKSDGGGLVEAAFPRYDTDGSKGSTDEELWVEADPNFPLQIRSLDGWSTCRVDQAQILHDAIGRWIAVQKRSPRNLLSRPRIDLSEATPERRVWVRKRYRWLRQTQEKRPNTARRELAAMLTAPAYRGVKIG